MMTTRITDAADPNTEPILATAAELGIEDYRTGSFKYSDDTSIQRTLRGIKSKLAEIAQLNEKYGIRGQYQNHAGGQNFGAAVWDLAGILRQIDSEWLGCQFDIRHATVEGGTTWPLEFRLISSHVQSADIKDFIWVEKNGKWATQNCPLGEGMVDFEKYLPMLAKSNFGGPLSLHYEYDLGGANSGKSELSIPKSKVLGAMKKDLAFFRKELTKANL
jgi:sugar phosphate isomerase/epimerase